METRLPTHEPVPGPRGSRFANGAVLLLVTCLASCGGPAILPKEVVLTAPPAPPKPLSIRVEPASVVEPRREGPTAEELATRAKIVASPDDPLGGKFFLAEATQGLPGRGSLVATIRTSSGDLQCNLFDDRAPVTVAGFVGLARGLRPFKDLSGEWVSRPLYDGTTFHRVIPGFMIQGGDPKGNGSGEPGYVIPDENWDGAKHDRAGLLCMANRGHDTNGAQFFITDAAAAHLDGNYTIFGECSPVAVVHAIANVPATGTKPRSDVTIRTIEIAREATPEAR